MKRTLLSILLTLSLAAPAEAQTWPTTSQGEVVPTSTPTSAPTPTPLTYDYTSDPVMTGCIRDDVVAADLLSRGVLFEESSITGLSNLQYCTFQAKDYAASAWLGQQIAAKMPSAPQDEIKIITNDGAYYYRTGVSFHKMGDISQAKEYIQKAYEFTKHDEMLDGTDLNPYAKGIRTELHQLNPQLGKTASANAAKAAKASTDALHKRVAAEMAAMSDDQQNVWLQEPGSPCHKEVFDSGDNYHKVTWWYCDDDGHYRKAYTFLNGKLISTYSP